MVTGGAARRLETSRGTKRRLKAPAQSTRAPGRARAAAPSRRTGAAVAAQHRPAAAAAAAAVAWERRDAPEDLGG